MHNVVGKHAISNKLESNILLIAEAAKKAKALYPDTIDATVGMLMQENGKIFKYHCIEDSLRNLPDEKIYPYAPVAGPATFRRGIASWLFDEHLPSIEAAFKYQIIPTTGGTAAVSDAMYDFNDFGQKILIANYFWTPYFNIAKEANLGLEFYRMYDEKYHFNIADFALKAKKLAKEQGRLFTVINDPCNNPTGLCIDLADWEKIIAVLNEIAETGAQVILLHDVAYIDYQQGGTKRSRAVFSLYERFHKNILIVVATSGSKTFSMYGYRVGAAVGLSKNPEIVESFTAASDHSVRSRFSSVSHPAMSAIADVLASPTKFAEFNTERSEATALLWTRAEKFISEANRVGLQTLPYGGGFFIGVETKNRNIFEELVNDHVFIVPMEGVIRVAISSVRSSDIANLVTILKKRV